MKNFKLALVTVFGFMLAGSILQAQDLVLEGEQPQQITDGHQFTEGPFWHSDGFLLYSDIPANQIYKWTPDGEKEVFLEPSGNSNGITGDGDDGMLIAQHAGHVAHVAKDGDVTVLVSTYDGKRLNSPNDLALRSDGTIYFTDPPYGVEEEDRELDFSGVYRLAEGADEPELLFDGFNRPNGIVLSPDENLFYVNDTETGQIMMFAISEDGTVSEGKLFAEVGPPARTGAADGMVVDENGNLYSTGPGGVHIFDSSGSELLQIATPENVTNLEWGGADNTTLFMTSPSGVYKIEMNVTGL